MNNGSLAQDLLYFLSFSRDPTVFWTQSFDPMVDLSIRLNYSKIWISLSSRPPHTLLSLQAYSDLFSLYCIIPRKWAGITGPFKGFLPHTLSPRKQWTSKKMSGTPNYPGFVVRTSLWESKMQKISTFYSKFVAALRIQKKRWRSIWFEAV